MLEHDPAPILICRLQQLWQNTFMPMLACTVGCRIEGRLGRADPFWHYSEMPPCHCGIPCKGIEGCQVPICQYPFLWVVSWFAWTRKVRTARYRQYIIRVGMNCCYDGCSWVPGKPKRGNATPGERAYRWPLWALSLLCSLRCQTPIAKWTGAQPLQPRMQRV